MENQNWQEREKELEETIEILAKKLKQEISQRRKYEEKMQDIKGNIRVFCRVRPGSSNSDSSVVCNDNLVSIFSEEKQQMFEFDRVLNQSSTQGKEF